MRTTLNLSDSLMREAKRKALDEGKSLTAVIEGALRAVLHPPAPSHKRYRFRPFIIKGGLQPGVDVADRRALYDRMEGRS